MSKKPKGLLFWEKGSTLGLVLGIALIAFGFCLFMYCNADAATLRMNVDQGGTPFSCDITGLVPWEPAKVAVVNTNLTLDVEAWCRSRDFNEDGVFELQDIFERVQEDFQLLNLGTCDGE